MKKKDAVRIFEGLHSCRNLPGVKFAYAITKNKKMLEPIADAMSQAIKPSVKWLEYEKKRLEVCRKFAKKDENELPIIKSGYYVFPPGGKDKVEAETSVLEKEYADPLSERKSQEEAYKALLEEEVEDKIAFHMIKLENVPDGITGAQMEAITEIIIQE